MRNILFCWMFFWIPAVQADIIVGMDTFIVLPRVASVLADDLAPRVQALRRGLRDGLQPYALLCKPPALFLHKENLFDESLQQIPAPLLKHMQALDFWFTVRFNHLSLDKTGKHCCVQSTLQAELLTVRIKDGRVRHFPIQVQALWLLSQDISTHWQAMFEALQTQLSEAIRTSVSQG